MPARPAKRWRAGARWPMPVRSARGKRGTGEAGRRALAAGSKTRRAERRRHKEMTDKIRGGGSETKIKRGEARDSEKRNEEKDKKTEQRKRHGEGSESKKKEENRGHWTRDLAASQKGDGPSG